MSSDLSPVQAKVFQFLKDRFYASGSMPTLREICKQMGWSAVGSAQTAVNALIDKKYLRRHPQKARGLQLMEIAEFRPIPILGSAPAGNPIESTENHEGEVTLPSFIRGPVFAIRVRGDSMQNAGIMDDDLVIVRQSAHADDNDIVVAMLSGEVTIKRFKKRREELWLVPENDRYKPKKIEDLQFRILGKVIGLHRYWG